MGRGLGAAHYAEDAGSGNGGGCVHHCTCGEDGDSGDEEVEFDHPDYRYHASPAALSPSPGSASASTPTNGKPLDNIQRRLLDAAQNGNGLGGRLPPTLPHAGSLSSDGYESFENTSNKKKRKIPLSSTTASALQQHQLSAEMASMGLNGSTDGALDDTAPAAASLHAQAPPHASGVSAAGSASGTGISGAGRGRYGRQNGYARNGERKPLTGSAGGANGGYGATRMPGKSGTGESLLPFCSHCAFLGCAGRTSQRQFRTSTRARIGTFTDLSSPVDLPNGVDSDKDKGGIISQAIKSAAEYGPLTPPSAAKADAGRDSRAATSSAPNTVTPKTQFTFSCESESASKMEQQAAAQQAAFAHAQAQAHAAYQQQQQHRDAVYAQAAYNTPGSYPAAAAATNLPGLNYRAATNGNGQASARAGQGTQSMSAPRQTAHLPPQASTRAAPTPAQAGPPPSAANTNSQAPHAPPPQPKPRRRPSKEYALAARQRQLQQEYTNYHHRPTKDNLWICEFCEYEDIFGVPPLAMIRSYEIRDRRERKKAEEKKRLLEKARAKGKRGRKGKGKGGGGQGGAAPAGGTGADPGYPAQDAGGHPPPPPPSMPMPEGEEGEFYDDDGGEEGYDDEDDYEEGEEYDAVADGADIHRGGGGYVGGLPHRHPAPQQTSGVGVAGKG